MTVSWKAQVSSAVGMIWSAGSRKLKSFLSNNLPLFNLLLPMESGVPELHAGGEANAHLPMGPVSGAATGNVQHAGNTANLIKQEWTAEMYGPQSTLTS